MTNIRKAIAGVALVGTAVFGGFIGASLVGSANAQSTDPSTTTPAAGAPAQPAAEPGGDHRGGGPHQSNGTTEVPLTGTDAEKATAAAKAAVPGATIDRVETDVDGDAFEAHVTKADGTRATVKMDSSFTVASVTTGR